MWTIIKEMPDIIKLTATSETYGKKKVWQWLVEGCRKSVLGVQH